MTDHQHQMTILVESGATVQDERGQLAEGYRRHAHDLEARLLVLARELDELREQMARLRDLTDRRTNEAALTMVAWSIPRARNHYTDEDPALAGSRDKP